MDWQNFVFDSSAHWIDRLTAIARRRFGNGSIADEAFNFAFDRISANDWDLLTKFAGRSQPGTFLITVFTNELEDFGRRKFGRPRPPVWLERLGDLWLRIFKMLCLERQEPETIVDRLCAGQTRDPNDIRHIVKTVRGKIPDCGKRTGEVLTDAVPDFGADDYAVSAPEDLITQADLAMLFNVLASLLSGDVDARQKPTSASTTALANAAFSNLSQLRESLVLSPEECLILRQIYQDNLSISAVARNLQLPDHQVRRNAQRAVARLHDALNSAGLTADVIRALLRG